MRKVFSASALKELAEGLKHIEAILDQRGERGNVQSTEVQSMDNEADDNSTTAQPGELGHFT